MNRAELTIPIPQAQLRNACDLDEMGFFEAYLCQYRAATVLIEQTGLEQEALGALRFAAECFLKHVLCAMRWHLLGPGDQRPKGLLEPGKLQHDLKSLAEWVGRLFSDLRDDATFARFKACLPKKNCEVDPIRRTILRAPIFMRAVDG